MSHLIRAAAISVIAEFSRRMRIFHGPGWLLPAAHPTIAAAAYPQVVALARLLISPYWRALATDFIGGHRRSLFDS